MSPLQSLLQSYRKLARSEREAGTLFEQLTICYLQNEPFYQQLYRSVQTYSDWAVSHNLTKQDTGIDLVAETNTGETHAIQCKFYNPEHRVQKANIDSFFTASGK